MGTISIRHATPKDSERLATIQADSWKSAYKKIVPKNILESISIQNWREEWMQKLANPGLNMLVLVASINKNIVAFCSAGKSRDADTSKHTGELYRIYVNPKTTHRGIGSLLMEHALKRLNKKGYRTAILWVLSSNTPARKFYEHRGWKMDGKTKTHFWKEFSPHQTRYTIALQPHIWSSIKYKLPNATQMIKYLLHHMKVP